jgi:glycosyltransferase involved in cell wall biosynthesis
MKSKPLVSVIISVFNEQDRIADAIKSILNQTYQNLEILVIDDCSTDDTLKIIKSINSPKIKIFSNSKNIGLTKSLNILIQNSKGDFIARQDADDISYPDRINSQLSYMERYNLHAVGSRAVLRNSGLKFPRLSFYLPIRFQVLFKNPLIHGTLLIRKSALKSLGLYDEDFYYAQDFKLLVDLLNANMNIKMMNKFFYELNTEDNISSVFKKEQRNYFHKAKKHYKIFNL